uniref:gluconokinase n=1 Tax=Ascaris lumbricoides TaxID=6252 RepID=A0A0M3IJJ6_ASCLU
MTEIRNFFTPVSLLPYARLFDSLSTNGDQCKSNYMQINRSYPYFNFPAAGMTIKCIFVMGVSGCGKTTVGKCLATKFEAHFEDADDYHSETNRAKMSRGIALNDEDRYPWLQKVANLAKYSTQKIVIACSALKRNYRQILRIALNDEDRYPWLQKVANLAKYSTQKIVIACSALKRNYRQILSAPLDGNYVFIYLNVERSVFFLLII